MTDKQIIIDGIDVSGCKNLMQGIIPFGCMEDRKTCSCMNNPNCIYKQLKRKELKCERLKQTLADIKEIAETAKKDICNNCGWRNTDSCDPEDYTCGEFIQILHKISEVEE